jgi:xanthine dehydrogenase YagT iron-sulfur-binding subunit
MREGHARSRTEIREAMSGNLCRCGAYVGIVDAIQAVMAEADGT